MGDVEGDSSATPAKQADVARMALRIEALEPKLRKSSLNCPPKHVAEAPRKNSRQQRNISNISNKLLRALYESRAALIV